MSARFGPRRALTILIMLAALAMMMLAEARAEDECPAQLEKSREEVAELKKLEEKVRQLEGKESRESRLMSEMTGLQQQVGKLSELNADLMKQGKIAEARFAEKIELLESRLESSKTSEDAALKQATNARVELDRIKSGQSSTSKLEHDIKELKTVINNKERALKELHTTVRRLKAEAASGGDRPLHAIALERAIDRYEQVRDFSTTYYSTRVVPSAKQAYYSLLPHAMQGWESLKPLRNKVNEQWDKVRPQYEREVKPHLEKATKEAKKYYKKMSAQGARLLEEFRAKYVIYRATCIETVRKQRSLAPHAETIIDGAVYMTVFLLVLYVVVPLCFSLLDLFLGIVYYGMCCCCCCGPRRKAAKKQPEVKPSQKSQATKRSAKQKSGAI